MKTIDPKQLQSNAFDLIQKGMLVTAGDRTKFNTMTANWGGVGFLWNKPVVFIFVRPERYTYEFMEAHEQFTLNFFSSEYAKVLAFCGTKSGRDYDKPAETGLKTIFTQSGNPAFEQAEMVIECSKLYGQMLDPELFLDKDSLAKWYGEKGSPHKMYIAEIENIFVR